MKLMRTEPTSTIGVTVSGILGGTWLVLKALGVDVATDLPSAIDVLVMALLAVPAISGWVTRFFVFSPKTVDEIAQTPTAVDPMDPATWTVTPVQMDGHGRPVTPLIVPPLGRTQPKQ